MRFGKFCGTNTSDVRRTMYDVQNQRLAAMGVACVFIALIFIKNALIFHFSAKKFAHVKYLS